MNRLRWLPAVLVIAACSRSLELPDPPGPPGPGSVQGQLVYAQPGQSMLRPAVGATVELLGTSLKATVMDDTGYFSLAPIPSETGSILLRFDSDGDGKVDRQKLIHLEDIKAGPGKTVALGQVALGLSAIMKGSILRSDALDSPTGHGGTSVFVPQGPNLTYTGDNGAFTFENLPEGNLAVSFFRAGYITQNSTVTLRAGEVFTLSNVLLVPETSPTPTTKVTGSVVLFGSSSNSGATVHLSGLETTATTDEAGRYTFESVPSGVYRLGVEKPGFVTVTLPNLAVAGTSAELPPVILVPGNSTPVDLDGGTQMPPTDGGMTDGGSADGGTDGGVDAGPPGPRAVISPPPAYVTAGFNFQLNGSMSTGDRPLVYHWAQTGGTTVAFSVNDSIAAATPTIQAPTASTLLKFSLKVTDINDVTSPAATVSVPVGAPPVARIAMGYPASAFASQQVQFDGSPSTDATGIVKYTWSVMPAGLVTATPQGAGEKVLLTMPASVATAQVVTVTLVVTNQIGIDSPPASVSFNLTTTTAPGWTVDAGAPQAVAGFSTVTISGIAAAPGVPTATFDYAWSPGREPASGTAEWQLTDASARTTTFVAPRVVGAPRLINFTLTATNTAGGLSPSQRTSTTWVSVIDREPPKVIGTNIVNGRGSSVGLVIDFDEPINPASVNGVSVFQTSGSSIPAPQISDRLVEGSRLTLVYRAGSAIEGASCYLQVSSVQDLAPSQPNFSANTTVPFIVESRWSPAHESTATSNSDPRPGLAVRELDGGVVEALVFGRKNGNAWFLAPVNPSACTSAPCPMADDGAAPSNALASTATRGERGLVHEGEAIAVAQLADPQGTPGLAFSKRTGAWASFPAPPGPIYSDESELFSVYADNGSIKLARFDETARTWGTGTATTIVTDATLYPTDATSDPLPLGAGTPVNEAHVLVKSSKTNELRAYRNEPKGSATWVAAGTLSPGTASDKAVEGRCALSPFYTGSCYGTYLTQSGRLQATVFGDVGNATTVWTSGVTSFSVGYHASAAWYVGAVGGQILIRVIPYGTFTVTGFDGPGAGGSLNADPSCVADHPEIKFVRQKVFVTWAERCGANPWRLYLRQLQ